MKKNKKGSMLVGVLLVMFMVASISLAIIYRTTQGTLIATDSKKSLSAYQGSDQKVENVLNEIKKIDDDIEAHPTSGKIPENVPASDVSCGTDPSCLDKDGHTADKVANIAEIKGSAISQSTKRAVSVPVPIRAINPLSDLTATHDSPNKCNAILNWIISSPLDANVENLELRFSTGISALNSGNWIRPIPYNLAYSSTVLTKKLNNKNFNYNTNYYFAIKAKNKNNFSLDSLYYPENNGINFNSPPMDCHSGQRVGCYEGPPLGSEISDNPYSCCQGTECYECKTGWDVTGSCCTQSCSSAPSCSCGAGECGSASVSCTENTCGAYTFNCDTSGCHSCTP